MTGRGEDHAVARTGRSTVRARAARERRVLRIGLVCSALLHLVLLGVLGGLLDAPAEGPPPRSTPVLAEPPSGMRAMNLRPVPGLDPAAPAQPRRPDPEPTPTVVPPRVVATPADAPVIDDRTAADRLAPRLIDPRLWRPMVLIPREPTLADVEARLGAAVELLSDSALAETERQLRALDWTVKDADGGRWGISPGKLHLGKLTLPLPIHYVEEYDPARGEWYDLEAQVDRTRFLESFEDRVRKIRERRDRERAEAKKEGGAVAGSGGSER